MNSGSPPGPIISSSASEVVGQPLFQFDDRRRPHIRRCHDSAETPRRSDRLQARNAGAHDEHARGRNRAGRRHHHRQRTLESGRGIDHDLVARKIRL